MKKLILFDIDGTLITSKHLHSKTFYIAIEKVYGIKTKIDWASIQGMTDREIVIDTLKKYGFKKKEIMKNLQKCSDLMAKNYKKNIRSGEIKALLGSKKLIKDLHKKGFKLGLVTGNIKPVAKVKLEQINLWKYFEVGGFGSDGFERHKLAKIAIKRSNKKFGKIPKKNIFQIGDTPKDILSGQKNKINSIGVATGRFNKKQLLKFKANHTLENLKDTKKILEIITSS